MDVHTLFREYPMIFQKPTPEDLILRYSYHQPRGNQAERYAAVRNRVLELAVYLVDKTPCSPEQSRMLNALDEVMFLANAAVARGEAGMDVMPAGWPPKPPAGPTYGTVGDDQLGLSQRPQVIGQPPPAARVLGAHRIGVYTSACVVCGLTRMQIEGGDPAVRDHCDAPTPPLQGVPQE